MHRREIRRQIAAEAAKLIVSGRESDFNSAKRRAARILGIRFTVSDFPTTREIKDAVRQIEEIADRGRIDVNPRRMKITAVRIMRLLKSFSPRLVGPLVDDNVRTGLEVTLLLLGDCPEVVRFITEAGFTPAVVDATAAEIRGIRSGTIHLDLDYCVTLQVFESRDGAEGVSLEELESELRSGAIDLDAEIEGIEAAGDRFDVLEDLVNGLENVPLDVLEHPEGNALFHALQLFDRVAGECPYDEELLTAALLHDVGRLSRGPEPMETGIGLLERIVTHRTRALITAMYLLEDDPPPSQNEIALLVGADDMESVQLLADYDRLARVPGAKTSSVNEAIDYLRRLEAGSEWE